MITVSVCMIVNNEEKNLPKCLDCLKDFADEIIIVDTGSTDNTKNIAKNYTDKIYDFEWVDDFSSARNFAFSKATMEYIYTADADEVIDEANQEKMMQIKHVLLPEIEIVQMNYTNQLEYGSTYNYDSEPRPKLFRRIREFRWQDPVHETVITEPVVYDSDIDIIHKPHENHAHRDLLTFKRAIESNRQELKNSDGVEASNYLYVTAGLSANARCMYAKELIMHGKDEDFIDAYEYFRGLADSGILDEQQLNEASCVIAHYAVIINDAVLLMKYAMKSIIISQVSEICNELGNFYLNNGDVEEAYMWFYNAAYETKPLLSLKSGHEIPMNNMIKCCELVGDEEQAEKIRTELKKKN